MRTRGDLDLNLRSAPQRREYREIYDRIIRDRPGRVLDWGCGHGHAAAAFHEAGMDVVAIDHDPDAHEVEEIELPRYPGMTALVTPQPVRLPLPDDSVDAVLSLGVLEHVPDPTGSLLEISRVLRPGGTLYVYKLPNRFSYLERIAKAANMSYHGSRPEDTLWTTRSARAALEEAGFAVAELRRANMLPLTIPGRLVTIATPLIWAVNRLLSRVPGLNALATNVEAVAVRRLHGGRS